MELNQLHELAHNATLNHWPPHLGVVTEQDKIQYLADRLREVADAETRADELAEQLKAAQDDIDRVADLEDQVKTLKSDLELAHTQLEQIREIVT